MTEKKSKITDENRAESAALLSIWKDKHTLSQHDFGEAYDLGNQSNVGHYLHARSQINLKAALAFSSHLDCKVADFSPRLARELQSVSHGETIHLDDGESTNAVRAYSGTNLVRAPVIAWARLGEDVLKDPQELGGAETLEYVQIGTPGRRAKLIAVNDDSLAPRLNIGDMVAIDPDNRSPERGQVTLFRSTADGRFFLRRYQPLVPPAFEAVDAQGKALDSSRHGLEIIGVRCGFVLGDL